MTGWRCGWVCGNEQIVKALGKVKDNYDSGVFSAIQYAGVVALTSSQECVEKNRKIYRERRDVLYYGLKRLGWKVKKPEATFYLWAKTPSGKNSIQTSEKLLLEAGVVATPGVGMGDSGEGYLRFALTVDVKRIEEALKRISKINW